MNKERKVEFETQRRLQAERIGGRKDWARFVELMTAIRRADSDRIAAELAAIREGLRRAARRA
jgi:hypothetical protein